MQQFWKKITLSFLAFTAVCSTAHSQQCEGLFPNSGQSSENLHREKTQAWIHQILHSNLLPEASDVEGKSTDFSFQLVRTKQLLREEKNGVLSGDGLYFFTQSQDLNLTKPDSRLLDVRTNAWAVLDHDFASINRSIFTQIGGSLWSRGSLASSSADHLLLKQNDVYHVRWYSPNGTLKTTQRFTFPVKVVFQIPTRSAWVILPEKNFDFLSHLIQDPSQKKGVLLSELLNQPILVYGQDPNQKDYRFTLEDSQHLSIGSDLISPEPVWSTGSHFIVRASSFLADTIESADIATKHSEDKQLSENEIYFWSASNGKKLIHLTKNFFLQSKIIEPIVSISLSPDEQYLACVFKSHLRFFNLSTESWSSIISWDGISSTNQWSPDSSIFLAQDSHSFLRIQLDSRPSADLDHKEFTLQVFPKHQYFNKDFNSHQPIQWINNRVFVTQSQKKLKTTAIDIQTGHPLNQIFRNLPGLIFNNSEIAYRVIKPEGSIHYQLEVYQKVNQKPK